MNRLVSNGLGFYQGSTDGVPNQRYDGYLWGNVNRLVNYDNYTDANLLARLHFNYQGYCGNQLWEPLSPNNPYKWHYKTMPYKSTNLMVDDKPNLPSVKDICYTSLKKLVPVPKKAEKFAPTYNITLILLSILAILVICQ